MTDRLYYTSPLLSSWDTEVKEVIEENEKYLVTLAATAFYPEGGGQPADHGYIDSIQVLDVVEKGDEIYHILPHPPSNSTVSCKIDYNRRIDHMQQHTGQHLLSAVCIELYDAHTVSFHLGEDTVTIDLSVSELTEVQMNSIENKVNEYIYENLPIDKYIVTVDQLTSLPLRKMPEVSEEIRIVEIKGIDTSACCGTHVMSTGQLGVMKLLKTEKQKGNMRLHFKCGKRALMDYQESSMILQKLSSKFSTNRSQLTDTVTKLENENKQLQKELEQLREKNDEFLAQDLLNNTHNAMIIQTFEEKTFKELQSLSKKVVNRTDKLLLLISTSEKKVLLSHSGTQTIHCGQLFKEHLPSFNGKGGGNASSAQGAFNSCDLMTQFVTFLEKRIIENDR
ncbi:alanyl-tRNA editing protein [Bacillus luteolus]|uniref:Alanyl-tRNA editing protein n=1 Tax=Litchfieldia luteola TaxID=682179 RepID=A0ABR9QJF7_9BACI|nr:DHHA1 domain-containing protein [Cytobacillus luteolus]MBE4908589.1 alanyl-tRNA editing protein [Cytobacillus luteolus]MBP1941444.1 alanyl-tRNA synthetase [Cytobacillus luteolus]